MFGRKKQEQIETRIKDIAESAQRSAMDAAIARLKEWFGGVEDIEGLRKQVKTLKDEIADLQQKKKLSEEEIKHLVKIKQESLAIEHQKKELELKNQFKDKEMELQKQYHKEAMAQIESARAEMKEIYQQILSRLPNVNMAILQENGNGKRR